MLKIRIHFIDNRGSFAVDTLATTLGGDWSGKSSTDTFGIVTNVSESNLDFAKEILNADENVSAWTYSIEG